MEKPEPIVLLVTIQPGESTRFLLNEFELARRVAASIEQLTTFHTKGPRPAVTVSVKKEAKCE